MLKSLHLTASYQNLTFLKATLHNCKYFSNLNFEATIDF